MTVSEQEIIGDGLWFSADKGNHCTVLHFHVEAAKFTSADALASLKIAAPDL